MQRNCSLFVFIFLLFFLTFTAQAIDFQVDGHQVQFEKGRGQSQFVVDGKTFQHSGKIRLQKALLFQPDLLRQVQSETQLYVVQFETQIFPSYRQELSKHNIEILKFVPDHALLVRAAVDQVADLQNQIHIKQVIPFGGEYKVPYLPTTLWVHPRNFTEATYDVLPIADSYRDELLQLAQSMNLKIVHDGLKTFALSVHGDLEAIQSLATDPRVLWIEISPDRIEEDMDIVLVQGGAQTLIQSTGQYEGEGIRGHVLEGIYKDHQDFAADEFRKGPIAIGDDASSYHGQKTFGIIYGNGFGDATARGLMPKAQGYYTNNKHVYNKDNRFQLTEELIRDHKILLQTASWGSPTTIEYTARSLEMDKIIFELDLPITQSQSNRSSKDSRPQAWAKNIISVGAVHHGNNTIFEDDSWSRGGASIGPATDNRIKPDIVSYYDAIHTTGQEKYSTFGGTSAATPIVNGHLGLIIEMYTDGVFGNKLDFPLEDRFANRPHASTAKALLINSARQYPFQGKTHDLTRTHQGWGHPNLQNLYDLKDKMLLVNEDHILHAMESKTYTVRVEKDTPQLAVTMVYSDPDGMVGAEIHRVNDLTVIVKSPDGEIFYGNHGLYENNFNLAGGQPDMINTVENVFVENPSPGDWEVQVIATEVNQDGHLETEEFDADYALVVSGIRPQE